MVTALVPSLSRSLAEQFNVFRVMHHGTHERQLSNVFAWLLRADATHGLGDTFQRIFVRQVSAQVAPGMALPATGYRVTQEVNTSGPDDLSADIADIVLTGENAVLVVENFESSDGHGHCYERYLRFGQAGGTALSVVVLLCHRHEPSRQRDGWENAVVLTYSELLGELQRHLAADARWQRAHPEPHFFISQLIDHFVEGAAAVNIDDQISFISTMCATGESARYGHQRHDVAGEEFANLVAQHARRQFEEARGTLGRVKRALKDHADRILVAQLNAGLAAGPVTSVKTPYKGQWQWCVALYRADAAHLFIEFGPTAVVENTRVPQPLAAPDYSRLFVTRRAEGGGIDLISQTDVGLYEVLAGLPSTDVRLRDALIEAASRSTTSERS